MDGTQNVGRHIPIFSFVFIDSEDEEQENLPTPVFDAGHLIEPLLIDA